MGFRRIFGTISLKNVFIEQPKLRLEYLSQDESGSLEIFTTDSVKDKGQNVRNKFSLEALSFFFVNCTKKLQFTHICRIKVTPADKVITSARILTKL
jgi:hypothetical protein